MKSAFDLTAQLLLHLPQYLLVTMLLLSWTYTVVTVRSLRKRLDACEKQHKDCLWQLEEISTKLLMLEMWKEKEDRKRNRFSRKARG